MKTEKFLVPDVSCQHCVRAVTDEVSKLDGVQGVQVNLETKIVTVEHSDSLAAEAIMSAITAAGYEQVSAVA